jgi:branched-subunit amino acid transport protein
MSMWVAVLLVALGSYAFRLVPMLLGERARLSERAETTLQHAAVGAMTALLVVGLRRAGGHTFGVEALAALIAVAVSSTVALMRRSMVLVVFLGAATYGGVVVVAGLAT